MSRFLRIPFVLNHLSRRFQQTQAKLATKIKIKQPYQPLGCLAGGPVFRNAKLFPDRVAVRDKIAAYTYGNVFMSAYQLSKEITNLLDCKSHEKVLFLCPNDVQYVITLWAIWMSGQLDSWLLERHLDPCHLPSAFHSATSQLLLEKHWKFYVQHWYRFSCDHVVVNT